MIGYLLVAAGAAVGAPLRYLTDRILQRGRRSGFPWGTLTVNIVGSAVFGALVAATVLSGGQTRLDLLLDTGFCGALTTYSTFSYETVRLLQLRARWSAVANVAGGITAGILAAAAGYAVALAALS